MNYRLIEFLVYLLVEMATLDQSTLKSHVPKIQNRSRSGYVDNQLIVDIRILTYGLQLVQLLSIPLSQYNGERTRYSAIRKSYQLKRGQLLKAPLAH